MYEINIYLHRIYNTPQFSNAFRTVLNSFADLLLAHKINGPQPKVKISRFTVVTPLFWNWKIFVK